MKCNQLCSINYGNTHQKRFFKHLLELRSLLEDKCKLLSKPFSFRFCLYKYHPSCPTTPAWLPPEILTNLCRTQNRPSALREDDCFSALLTLQWIANLHHKNTTVSVRCWHCNGMLSLGYSRAKPGMCERVYKQNKHHCWLIDRLATGHRSG